MAVAAGGDDLKHGPFAKVGTALQQAWKEFKTHIASGKAAGAFHASDRLLHGSADRVAIEAYAVGGGAVTLEKDLKGLAMSNVQRYGNAVTGLFPYGSLDKLAALKSLTFARPIWYRTRSVTGQQDAAIRGDIARSTYGFTGSGVKVGILSDSFDTGPGSYASDVASGDLPAGVQVIQDSANGTDEGRAMAQLVYDTAPGASLAFATAFEGGQSGFANNIKALRDAGAKVIIDDVAYFAEPMFQDGVIAQAVDNVVGTNVAYFSAAGNEGRQAYQSAFRTGISRADGSIRSQGAFAPHFFGGLTHDFDPGPGVDDMQSFSLAPGQSITLSFQWDQPYGSVPGSASSASDMDIYVLNSGATRVVGGTATTNAGAGLDPVEVFSFTNNGGSTTTYNLMIVRYSGVSPGLMKYVNYDTQNFTQFNTNSGAIFGHANAAGAAAVGAAAWYNTPAYGVNPPAINSYSSRGGTPILFSATGTLLGSQVNRQRPQITAPDGGNTTFFYSDSTADADTLPNFFGTSAAAPAAGAVAALLLQAQPSFTPAQIYSTLQNTALDMDDPFTGGFDSGFDDATGLGLVRADAAVASVIPTGSVAGTAFHDLDADGILDGGESPVSGATIFDDANNNGSVDGGEASTTTSGSGTFTLANVPSGSRRIREIAPLSFFATNSPITLNVTGAMSGVNLANVATVYNGTGGSDQYLLRRKAADTKYEILIGGSLAYTLPATALPQLTFNLLGGTDTFTLDLVNGGAIPPGGVNLDTGGAGDTLAVVGSVSADTATFNAASVSIAGLTLSHANVENITYNGQGGGDTLTVNNGASVTFVSAGQKLQLLTVATGAAAIVPAANSTLYLQSLQLQGRLDLNDNDLVVDSAAFTTIRSLVLAGFSAVPDATRSGIVSTTSQNTGGSTILALFDNAFLGATEWPPGSGQTVSANAIIGKYTYFGDANIDGQVTGDDYTVIDANLNTTPPLALSWLSGDMNLDGVITGDDYTVIDANLGLGVGNPL